LLTIIILALPWAHALTQTPRRPFVTASLVGGVAGALALAVVTALTEAPNPEYNALRSMGAALLMGGPLGTLLGQALVAMFVAPRARQTGAVLGCLVGPVLGWPPLYLFPVLSEHHLWQGEYFVGFWLGSWAGWCALGGAALGLWTRTWEPVWKLGLTGLLLVLIVPAMVVGGLHFREIRLHVTMVDTLAAQRDINGLIWKLDRGEEVAAAAAALGPLGRGSDEHVVLRLSAVLDGTGRGLEGRDRSDPEYRLARCRAAESLGQIGGHMALKALMRNEGEADPQVRMAVVHAVGAQDDPLARQALARAAATDPDDDLRAWAAEQLRAGPASHP